MSLTRPLKRQIRHAKREVMEAVDLADGETKPNLEEQYQKKAKLLQKQNTEYNHFCEENDLRPLQDRLKVAGWDRKQAASATAITRKNLDKYAQFRYNEDGPLWSLMTGLSGAKYLFQSSINFLP